MGTERKDARVCIRLPTSLVARADYVGRNIDSDVVKNRSTAVQAALEAWLPSQEKRIEELLGPPPKKAR